MSTKGEEEKINRMIYQREVREDQERVEDRSMVLAAGKIYLLQVGSRRFARINLKVG